MMRKRSGRVIVFFVCIFLLNGGLFAAGNDGPSEGLIAELKLFNRAVAAIQEGYVGNVEARELLYEAVRGMLESLDKYSQFIGKDQYELLQIDMKGEYAGVGITLALLDDLPAIRELQAGGAAERAGLAIKDKILMVDGISTKGHPLAEVAKWLRGDAGTSAVLKILRDATNEEFDVTLVRETIEIPAVQDTRIVEGAIGYVRITNFQENTIEQFDEAIKQLRQEGMEALIIDLRNNGGGLLPAAVDLAERFLPKGKKIVSVESKIDVQRQEYVSSGKNVIPVKKLVVLVNEGSASASEVFSAAVQENNLGIIIGMKTYGKASVQSVVPLDDVTAMKLTTARYVTPKGNVIDEKGVDPDEVVESTMHGKTSGNFQLLRGLELLKDFA